MQVQKQMARQSSYHFHSCEAVLIDATLTYENLPVGVHLQGSPYYYKLTECINQPHSAAHVTPPTSFRPFPPLALSSIDNMLPRPAANRQAANK